MNLQKKMIYLQKDNLIQCYKKIKDSLDTNHTSNEKKISLITNQFSTVYDLAYNSISSLQAEINERLKTFHFHTKEHFNLSMRNFLNTYRLHLQIHHQARTP